LSPDSTVPIDLFQPSTNYVPDRPWGPPPGMPANYGTVFSGFGGRGSFPSGRGPLRAASRAGAASAARHEPYARIPTQPKANPISHNTCSDDAGNENLNEDVDNSPVALVSSSSSLRPPRTTQRKQPPPTPESRDTWRRKFGAWKPSVVIGSPLALPGENLSRVELADRNAAAWQARCEFYDYEPYFTHMLSRAITDRRNLDNWDREHILPQ
jgi:hypothetical protein